MTLSRAPSVYPRHARDGTVGGKAGLCVVSGLCPGCTFLVWPIFTEEVGTCDLPVSTPKDLGNAIADSAS